MALLRKPVVAVAAAKLNEEMGEFASVSRKITPETKGKGSQIQVYVNRPSQVFTGTSIPTGYDPGVEKQVNIQLNNYANSKWVNTIEKTNDLIEEEEQILAPMRVGLQHEAKTQFYNLGLATANQTFQGTVNPQTNLPFQMVDIAKAIAAVKMSGVGGKVHVLIPSDAAAIAAGSQWPMFTQGPNEKLFNNDLGSFYGATWHETNVSGIRQQVFTSATTIGATAQEGQTWLTLNDPSFTVGLKIPGGTQFTVAGVNAVNVYGNPISSLATFAVLADTVVTTAGSVVVPIGKALFTSAATQANPAGLNWGLNPTVPQPPYGSSIGSGSSLAFFTTLPQNAAAVTQVNAGKGTIIVYSELALAFAAASPAEMARKEEYLVRPNGGIPILVGVQGTNESGVANYRMDAIWGLSGVYAPGCATVNYTP